ncbi:hypothetical protein RF11_01008 [Thelohanellus kitauei]|uniref:Uncharacterized protein n=1 Tax=Thelohanellus kitauei TaxID=669202 RepID=A0A0C2M6U1_THEKT|nr:hypothetical protein RF11_01008 [Thelohanellus kitauei]
MLIVRNRQIFKRTLPSENSTTLTEHANATTLGDPVNTTITLSDPASTPTVLAETTSTTKLPDPVTVAPTTAAHDTKLRVYDYEFGQNGTHPTLGTSDSLGRYATFSKKARNH